MKFRLWLTLGISLVALLALGACSSGGDTTPEPDAADKLATGDVAALQLTSSEAMAAVESVRFTLERTGAPVFIDPASVIALDLLEGRFIVPGSADAILQVSVNESLNTKLGAVAIDDEVWLSNPVTGNFETLPPGFDIDPSQFFDPKGGWQPLIAELRDVVFVAEESRGGSTRYHLTATAGSERIQAVTAGLVRNQDVDLDLWLDPVTGEVASMEFSTVFDGATSDWKLELFDFGETFEIVPPVE